MSNILAIIALLFAAQPQALDKVRMGLFSLFKPEVVHARIASGQSAILETGGATGSRIVVKGDTIRARTVDNRLRVTVSDPFGRVKQSFEAREVRGEVSLVAGNGARDPVKIILTTSREAAVASIVAAELSGYRASETLK